VTAGGQTSDASTEHWLASCFGGLSLSFSFDVEYGGGQFRAVLSAAVLVLLANLISGPALAGHSSPREADRILVLKSERKLLLLHDGAILRSYPIALGSHAIGPKRAEGDGRTPEGLYVIDGRHAHSPYHLALHISYPNGADRAQSTAAHVVPGGNIFIHGLPRWYGPADPARFYKDWTKGCISVGNTAIEEIWTAVADGTPIEIRP